MAVTYEPIATTTLGSAASNITFTSISNNYTDLILVVQGNLTAGGTAGTGIRVGSGSIDTSANYSCTQLDGNGSTAASYRDTNFTDWNIGIISSGTNQSITIIHFINYANTTTYKTVLSRTADSNYLRAAVGLWRSTNAINQIQFRNPSNNLAAGTMATLYGIKAA